MVAMICKNKCAEVNFLPSSVLVPDKIDYFWTEIEGLILFRDSNMFYGSIILE